MMTSLTIEVGKVLLVLIGVLNLAAVLTWMERKQSAVMQDRIGANRASILGFRAFGLFQVLADSIKMFAKEDFVPPMGNRFLHTLAPFVSAFFALIGFAAIPFGNVIHLFGRDITLQVIDLNVGILYIFAAMSLGIYGVVLAGWSSNNNYAFLGGMRGSSQMFSYEITIGATILGVLMIFESMSLQTIVQAQGELLWGVIPKWGVVVQPIGCLLFLVAGIAETKRVPFDLPEGESEIIGYFVEYSSMKFGLFMLTDFVETILIAALVTTLFFGGWQIPYLTADGFHFPGGFTLSLSEVAVCLLQVLSCCTKVFFFCWFLLLVRWTLPRFRYDQLMRLGWKMVFPMSILNLLATSLVILLLQ
ncbi:MAG: NADH-quinone oxidoreductase subunit H [Acidobacteria bacterium]|nr:MAG: NADH-quinone oxidoreductase subunit H [Acidobacteriota bacterium]